MKKEYIEEVPAKEVLHKIIVCDNQFCQTVIEDNGELITEHIQVGNGRDLIDCCSQKCAKIMSNNTKEV